MNPGGEFNVALLRQHTSLGFDYAGEAWFYQAGDTITPVIGGTVDIVYAADGAVTANGAPALIHGYILKSVTGREIARFDRDGWATAVTPEGGTQPVAVSGRNRARLVRFHYPKPGHPLEAAIPVARAGLPIEVFHTAAEYTRSVLTNSAGKREVVYVHREGVNDQMLQQLERRLQAFGQSRKGGLLALPREVSIEEVGAQAIAAEVDGVSAAALRQILDVWQMPNSMIGRGGDRTYENQGTELLQWLRGYILPRLDLIASALTHLGTGVEYYWDTSGCPVLSADYTDSTERGVLLWNSDAITLNELRRMSGLDDVDGPEGEMRLSELRPAALAVSPPPFQGDPVSDQQDDEPEQQPEPTERTVRRDAADTLAHALDTAAVDAAGPFAEYAQRLHSRIARRFEAAARRAAGVIRDDGDVPAPQQGTADEFIGAARLAEELAADAPALYAAMVDALLVAHIEATRTAGYTALADRMGEPAVVKSRFEQVIEAQRNRLVLGDGDFYAGWVDTIRDELEDALIASRGRGESLEQLIARVYRLLDVDGSSPTVIGARAEMIARTEAASLSNALAYAQWEEAGVTKEKIWYSIGDNRTRVSHKKVAGKQIPWAAEFEVGGYKAKHPHDPRLPASEVVNCRCRLLPVPFD